MSPRLLVCPEDPPKLVLDPSVCVSISVVSVTYYTHDICLLMRWHLDKERAGRQSDASHSLSWGTCAVTMTCSAPPRVESPALHPVSVVKRDVSWEPLCGG